MTRLQFAQISDIHISSIGDHHEMLSSRSDAFLAGIFSRLNQLNHLDFVLISGDLFDQASHEELERFQQVIKILRKPCYIIPGNHDRHPPERESGLTRQQFARRFNPQYADRPRHAGAQAGYWSVAVHPQVQLIGLDSIRDEDWGGWIDDTQFEWLQTELNRHPDKLVILAVHHPLHPLSAIDQRPEWQNFVLDNGPELLALLDDHPQVKLVLTGHHHLAKADRLGQRLHLAAPSIVIYPCGYRTLELARQADDRWQLDWRWHPSTDAATVAQAHTLLVDTLQEIGFTPKEARAYAASAHGSTADRHGSTTL